ncbi:MAG: DNA recombination protein RmuC [Candidatus Acidiferrales bacterium]
MNGWLMLLLGTGVGGAFVWIWSSLRANVLVSTCRIESEGKVRAAEGAAIELRARISELRQSLEQTSKDLAIVRDHLKLESEMKVATQSELNQVRQTVEDISSLRDRLKTEGEMRIAAETHLQEAKTSFEEQRRLLDDARQKLSETFSALSADALSRNNDAFLSLAKGSFETIEARATGDLETRQKAIEGLVNPLKETLGRYEKQISEMENARQNAYGSLHEQVENLITTNHDLQKETGNLVTALRSPQVRGRWGEMTLRRVAELAGMSSHCDFNEQETLENEAARQRPDMIVNLPGSRRIVVDAKVPLQAFLDASSASTEQEKKAHTLRHSQIVRTHLNQLAAKNYWDQFEQAPEIVILFLPGESFLSPALQQDPRLLEDGVEKHVMLATPSTLIALLTSIAYGWRQDSAAKNAQAIGELGKQIYDRIRTFASHYASVGSALHKAVDSYNKATGSLENRVLPSARKFRELGATTGDEIIEVDPIDELPRALNALELISNLALPVTPLTTGQTESSVAPGADSI